MAEAKEYIGLWTKTDKNGNPFLSGSLKDEAGETQTLFFVFRDGKDPSKKTLHTLDKTIPDAKFVKLGVLENGSNDNGEFQRLGNMFIFKNDRREKETHPDFNLVIYEEEKAEA